jgi:hypothetical protein
LPDVDQDQVERAVPRRVEADVVAPDPQVRPAARSGQPGRVQVGGQHLAMGADLVGEPVRDSAAAGADFPYVPPGAEPDLSQVPERRLVEQR